MHPTILIAHGSPDPDWKTPLEDCARRLRSLAPGCLVELAYMEFVRPSFDDVVSRLAEQGYSTALVLPAFLSPGGRHIKEHVPALVQAASQRFDVTLLLSPGSLGAQPEVTAALADAALRLMKSASTGGGAS